MNKKGAEDFLCKTSLSNVLKRQILIDFNRFYQGIGNKSSKFLCQIFEFRLCNVLVVSYLECALGHPAKVGRGRVRVRVRLVTLTLTLPTFAGCPSAHSIIFRIYLLSICTNFNSKVSNM